MSTHRGFRRLDPLLRRLGEEDGASFGMVLLVLLGIVVVLAAVAVLVSPGLRCRIDPPCALPAASTPPESYAFVSEPVGEPPTDGWIEVVPSEVFVEPGTGGTQFTLEAVWRDEEGFVVPPVYSTPLSWKVDPPLTELITTDRTVTLFVPGPVGQAQTATVSAAAPGGSSTAPSASVTVQMMPPSAADRVNASHAPGATPTAVLADLELKDNTLLTDKPMAFVRERELGDVTQGGSAWGSVLILSPSQRPEVAQPPNGAGPGASIGGSPGSTSTSPPSRLEIDVAIWVAIPASDIANGVVPGDVAAQANLDLLWTNDAYARARAGIHFATWGGAPAVLDPADATEAVIVDEVNTACKNQTWGDLPIREPKILNVYYVGSSGPEGIAGSVADEPVACLGWVSVRSLSVLAHELGHTLGLADEYLWPETPFTAANIMGYLQSEHTAPRDQLSVGQVFRVAMSDYSWLIDGDLVDWSGVNCFATTCPARTLDLPRTPKP